MENLPTDIILEIKEYIPNIFLYKTSKKNFNNNYSKIIENYTLKDKEFQKYIKRLVVKDCHFQFNMLLNLHYKQWLNTKKWIFKNTTYFNYLEFLKYICIENKSNKCLILLNNKLNTTKQNKYKNRIKSTLWSN